MTHCLYVDFEDNPAGVVERLLALGASPDTIRERFHYVRPDDPIDAAARLRIGQILDRYPIALAVIDGVTEAMVSSGWSIIDNDDVARFYASLPRVLTRAGVTVILIDHVTKDRDTRGRHAIGGQHKLAGIDGAAYSLEVVKPFGRGRDGVAKIMVTKDRPGYVRSFAAGGKLVGEMHVKSAENGSVSVTIQPPMELAEGEKFRHTILMERISLWIETHPDGYSKNQLSDSVKGNTAQIPKAVDDLVEVGYMRKIDGRYWLAKKYRQSGEYPHGEVFRGCDPQELEPF